MYEEGSETSYAEILMKELIQKDSKWFAAIYDMANKAPAKLAPSFGRKASSVLGQYNPTSKTQDKNNPASWYVEHFKNVKVTFYNGDGEVTSAVSNAQDILSMASVYAFYNGITDLDTIRTYVNDLWTKSHSYQASLEMSITATAAWIRTRLRKREIPSWKARIPLYPDEISTRRSEQTQAMRSSTRPEIRFL